MEANKYYVLLDPKDKDETQLIEDFEGNPESYDTPEEAEDAGESVWFNGECNSYLVLQAIFYKEGE